jgi:flagellar protein FliO/FliZ
MRIVIAMLFAHALLGPDLAFADSAAFADPQTVNALPVSGVSSVGYVTVALAIVLGLIYGAAWLLRRMRTFNGGARQSMQVMESIAVGAKERVVLVRIKNQQVLLGIAPGRVNLLLDMGKVDDAPASDSTTAVTQPQLPTFKQLLKRSMGLS